MRILDWNYGTFYYCVIQTAAILIIYFLRKRRIIKSGPPKVHYILGLVIGHIVYVFRESILLIIAVSCWPIIGILDGDFGISYIYVIAILITYFLRKKGIVTHGSPWIHYFLGLIIGHVIYVIYILWELAHGGLMP